MRSLDQFKPAIHQFAMRVRKSRWGRPLVLAGAGSAFVWRSMLPRTRFISITGSFGKTTAKECLAAILHKSAKTLKSHRNTNSGWGVAKTLLAVRPWHRFAVMELGTDHRGAMLRASALVRPQVVIQLRVDRAHTGAFRTLEDTAAEKSQLLHFMSRSGTAVLNGDDERVAAMAARAPGAVLTFGTNPDHDVWATDISSRWPERLSFIVHTKNETAGVRTRLVGKHWTSSVLGAISGALTCGVSLADAAARVARVEPFDGRMKPHTLPGGAVILRDDFNGSIASFAPAVEVLREARAARRVLVIGDCSDFRKKPRERIEYYAKIAREVTEMVIFIGERCEYGVRRAIREGFDEQSARGFYDLREAAGWLGAELAAGDLALLRGTHAQHLGRLYFRLIGEVECTQTNCRNRCSCDECPQLGFTPRPPAAAPINVARLRSVRQQPETR